MNEVEECNAHYFVKEVSWKFEELKSLILTLFLFPCWIREIKYVKVKA